MKRTIAALLSLFVALALAAQTGFAAQSVGYSVDLSGVGGGLEAGIRASSLLASLNSAGKVAPFTLMERARGDYDRIQTVLDSYGYYAAKIDITIDGKRPSNPDLVGALTALPEGQSVKVAIAVDAGPLYHLGKVVIEGDVPTKDRGALELQSGAPAVAADVRAAQARLLLALQQDGYAFARIDEPVVTEDDSAHLLDVSFPVETGPRVTIGKIEFQGLHTVDETFARALLTVHTGELYDPTKIDAARQKLASLGVFDGVSVRAAEKPSKNDTVDIVFDVQESKLHTVALTAAFSTDLGISGSVSWTHHNLLGHAEHLTLSAAVTNIGGTASNGIGYDLRAQFVQPYFLDPDQALEANLSAVKQDLDAYDQTAQTAAANVRRKFSKFWNGSAGLTLTHDEVTQEGMNRLYELISLPVSASFDDTGLSDPLADPTHGARATLSVTPIVAMGTTDLIFAILQASGSTYFDVSGDGRSVLALRALAAAIEGGNNIDVPPDQRLYNGGSGTVRGFRYQSIGPRFPDGNPVGATSMDAGSIEFRQRIGEEWGAAVFVDAGQASTEHVPFTGDLNVGVGAGVRYYTPIGAVRADLAVPLTQFNNRDSFEVYIGLGQAF